MLAGSCRPLPAPRCRGTATQGACPHQDHTVTNIQATLSELGDYAGETRFPGSLENRKPWRGWAGQGMLPGLPESPPHRAWASLARSTQLVRVSQMLENKMPPESDFLTRGLLQPLPAWSRQRLVLWHELGDARKQRFCSFWERRGPWGPGVGIPDKHPSEGGGAELCPLWVGTQLALPWPVLYPGLPSLCMALVPSCLFWPA